MDPLIWAVILLLVGLTLIVLELFVPSGGVIGVLSAAAILGAIVVAFSGGPKSGVAILIASLVIVPTLIAFMIRVWPETPLGRMILIRLPEDQDEVLPDSDYRRELKGLVGRIGRVRSPMRPSGLIEIDGRTYDATSPGLSLEVGEPIEVASLSMNRLVVRPCELAPDPATRSPAAVPVASDDPLSQPIEQFGIEPLDDPLA
ncbi:MAG: hypothetical protein KDA71_14940 [Planctomycetales bacterium]|nr:hypothetical protein [Planctomycetales bacterium]